MAAKAKNSGLGKGLDALFSDNMTEELGSSTELLLDEITPNREQPRKEFDQEALQELADSIAQHGVLQPVLVRPLLNGGYQLVAGERRFRASMMAGLTTIPAVIREMSDSEAMELALIENLQRRDLNPIEEAQGVKQLMDSYGLTHQEIADRLSKSRESITNNLRLLRLPDEVAQMVADGRLSASHARTLLSFEDEQQIIKIAREAVEKNLSVRSLEKMANDAKKTRKSSSKNPETNDIMKRPTIFTDTELQLSELLGRRVRVRESNSKGTLEIDFYNEDDLIQLARCFTGW